MQTKGPAKTLHGPRLGLSDCKSDFLKDPQVMIAENPVNWMQDTERLLSAHFSQSPDVRSWAAPLTERLSLLLLERLSPETGHALFSLLPQSSEEPFPGRALEDFQINRDSQAALRRSARANADFSIGFSTFIETAAQVLGSAGARMHARRGEPENAEGFSRELAEHFLWVVLKGVPGELKTRIRENLPLELRTRMDLEEAGFSESRVA